MMNHEDQRALTLFNDLARVHDVIPKLATAGERLVVLTDATDADAERSRLFSDLCDLYEGIVPANHAFDEPKSLARSITLGKTLRKNLCASIDALLDQLAAADVKGRLWLVKVSLAFQQIQDLARTESERLRSAMLANDASVAWQTQAVESRFSPNRETLAA